MTRRSRKKDDIWRRLDPAEAAHVTLSVHGEGAGAEILLRAFLCERDLNPRGVRFWLRVYDLCNSASDEARQKTFHAKQTPARD